MPLQYIRDYMGATTAVVIPIEEWKIITSKHEDLKKLEQQQSSTNSAKTVKPSDLAGTLSEEGYEAIYEHIKKVRDEWDRTVF